MLKEGKAGGKGSGGGREACPEAPGQTRRGYAGETSLLGSEAGEGRWLQVVQACVLGKRQPGSVNTPAVPV